MNVLFPPLLDQYFVFTDTDLCLCFFADTVQTLFTTTAQHITAQHITCACLVSVCLQCLKSNFSNGAQWSSLLIFTLIFVLFFVVDQSSSNSSLWSFRLSPLLLLLLLLQLKFHLMVSDLLFGPRHSLLSATQHQASNKQKVQQQQPRQHSSALIYTALSPMHTYSAHIAPASTI